MASKSQVYVNIHMTTRECAHDTMEFLDPWSSMAVVNLTKGQFSFPTPPRTPKTDVSSARYRPRTKNHVQIGTFGAILQLRYTSGMPHTSTTHFFEVVRLNWYIVQSVYSPRRHVRVVRSEITCASKMPTIENTHQSKIILCGQNVCCARKFQDWLGVLDYGYRVNCEVIAFNIDMLFTNC